MGTFRLELLGGFSIRGTTGEVCVLPTKKARALLAYLALPAWKFHSRDKLTALLWGDTAEAQAKHSFRQALLTLRRGLGGGTPEAILIRGDTVGLDPAVVAVDVADFESALADGSVEALARAAELYKGDLLDGFSLDEAPFEEWRVLERERLRDLALEGLARLLREQRRAESPEPAIQTARRILGMDPLQEAVHRTLMRLLVSQGRRAAALEQYQVCVGWLRRELGTEPEEETRQLYREILRTAARAAATGSRAAEIPLIGRQAELERLRRALARMLDEGGHVVLVSGEAGIGKSRLLQEFVTLAAASGPRVVFGRCYETEQTLPLRPWVDALRGDRPVLDPSIRDRLDAVASAELVRVFPELRQSEDQPFTTSAQHALLFDALTALVGELASEQPVVIVIEDLHWADDMSARCLAFLGRRIRRQPILLVGSMRPEEPIGAPALAQALGELRVDGRLDEIALGALSEGESRELARALQPRGRAGADRDRIEKEIWALSEGNPFVIVESMRALGGESAETWIRESRLAHSVQDFVSARLERLGGLPRHVVAIAAAIGRDVPFALLARAARVSEREGAEVVEELVRRRILEMAGDHLAFCHDWIRRVAYERLLPSTRAVLHAAIAEALEDTHRERMDDVAPQLGYHYSEAGDARRAIPHLVRFAELAAQRYALDDAYRALQQAMGGVDQLPAAERDRCRLDLALRQAFALSLLGRHRELLELLGAHAGCLKRVADPALASDYYFRLALTHLYFCEQAQGRLAAEEALREGERSGDPEHIGKALHVLAVQAFWSGNPRDGVAYATRALPLLDRPRTQHYLGLAHYDLGLNNIAAGSLGPALEAAERAEAVGDATHDLRLQALAGYVAAWALALRGDCELAVTKAHRSIDLAPDRLAASLATGALGHAYLEGGDAASAIPALERAVDTLGKIPIGYAERRNMVLLGEAYLLGGDIVRARETIGRALELSQADGTPFNIGLAHRALGRLALAGRDLGEADSRLSQALSTFTECSATFEAGRTHLDLATVRAALGEKDAAQAHLATALEIFEAADAPKRAATARTPTPAAQKGRAWLT